MLITDDKREIEGFIHQQADLWDLRPIEVKWSRMKRALGEARSDQYDRRSIKLSRPLFLDIGMPDLVEDFDVSRDLLQDTILHEIAHLMDYKFHGQGGHGWVWKKYARKVGAEPERVTHIPMEVRELMAPYYYQCENCDLIWRYLYRRPGSNSRRSACKECLDKGVDFEDCVFKVQPNPNQLI